MPIDQPADGLLTRPLAPDLGLTDAVQLPARRLGPLSGYARRAKIEYFLGKLPKGARILDVGCADNWFKEAAAKAGWQNVIGLDLFPPADIVGDVREWKSMGIPPHSFDALVAFEVVEHGHFAQAFHELLKPDGVLILTTPLPRMDGVCRILESMRLLQRRSSPHTNLIDLRDFPHFETVERRIRAGLSQWGILRPVQYPAAVEGDSANR